MQKVKKFGDSLKEQLYASVQDRLYHFVMAGDTIRAVAVKGTRMINEMRWNHELGVLETLVLGHAYLSAALLSAGLKGNDRLSLDVECSGPIKGLSVESNAFGEVRGFLKNVPITITKPLESFDLSPFFGAGFLSVTKYLQDAKSPFTGKIMMEYGSLAKDLSLYHLKSEQIPTAISLGIVFDKAGEVQGAGGLLLQALPGAADDVLERLEQMMVGLPSLGQVVESPDFPEAWLQNAFDDLQPRILDQRGVEFMCHCNREKFRSMLSMLDLEELEDIARRGPFPLELRCHHCNTGYSYDRDEISAIAASKQQPR